MNKNKSKLDPSKQTALITGASSGIGWAFAQVFAEHKYNLVLTARRDERLNKLKDMLEGRHGIDVHCIPCDLAGTQASRHLFHAVEQKGIEIDALVNNAGFGLIGEFAQSDVTQMTDMVQVNITALMQLTRLFLDEMIQRKRGYILNVASTAAFVPGPLMSVYFASKAFVLSFSESLADELKGTGIRVTVFCPGAIKSEFQSLAYGEDLAVTMNKKIPSSYEAARRGYEALMNNRQVALMGAYKIILPLLCHILPRNLIARIVRSVHEERKPHARNLNTGVTPYGPHL